MDENGKDGSGLQKKEMRVSLERLLAEGLTVKTGEEVIVIVNDGNDDVSA